MEYGLLQTYELWYAHHVGRRAMGYTALKGYDGFSTVIGTVDVSESPYRSPTIISILSNIYDMVFLSEY